MTPREYANLLEMAYGRERAQRLAATEAAIRSPSGNLDGWWSEVLNAFDKKETRDEPAR